MECSPNMGKLQIIGIVYEVYFVNAKVGVLPFVDAFLYKISCYTEPYYVRPYFILLIDSTYR